MRNKRTEANMTDLMTQRDVRAAFANQIDYCRANDAPITARIIVAVLAGLAGPGGFLAAVRNWPGLPVADALALRCAAGLHALHLAGVEPQLAPLYAGDPAAMADADALVAAAIARHEIALMPWLDSPPQTNEAGRSWAYIAAMRWLAGRGLPDRFEALEIGSSAGINLMIDRYRFDLGGVTVGADDAAMELRPDWRGDPPPQANVTIASLRGCDIAPIDLTDPASVLRLKAYVWPEHRERFARLDAAATAARERRPDLVRADADAFVEAALAMPQAVGTTRMLMHSIVWQYLGSERQARISAAMSAAAARASAGRPLAWIALEANRDTFRHELIVRQWPGDGEPHRLGHAHAHGAWVEWHA